MTRLHDQPLWHPDEDPEDAPFSCEECGDPVPDDRPWCSETCERSWKEDAGDCTCDFTGGALCPSCLEYDEGTR